VNFWQSELLQSYGGLKFQNVKFFKKHFEFLKLPLTVKFSKFRCESFHRNTDWRVVLCSNFVKFGRREIGEIICGLPDKRRQQKFVWLSSYRYGTDRAKNLPGPALNMYSECSRFHQNRFTFGTVVARTPPKHAVKSIKYSAEAELRAE